MAQEIEFTLNDGTKLQAEWGGPWTPREQIDWEENFRSSINTVFKAIGAERRALSAASDGDGDGDADEVRASHFRIQWVLFFGWHRARAAGKVAGKFSVFLDTLADYDLIDSPDAADAELDGLVEAGSLDPTSTTAAP